MKTLIVYYTWHNGNTKRIAEMIHQAIDADLCQIDTVKPYPSVYREASDLGKKEVETKAEPPIKEIPYDVKDYERIIIGTPTWWYTMAPAVRTFINNNDFSGKVVVPFMTNAGWPGTVIRDMSALCQGANIQNAKEVLFDSNGGNTLVTPIDELNGWIDSL